MIFCPSCGTELPDSDKEQFCISCGSLVPASTSANSQSFAAFETAAPTANLFAENTPPAAAPANLFDIAPTDTESPAGNLFAEKAEASAVPDLAPAPAEASASIQKNLFELDADIAGSAPASPSAATDPSMPQPVASAKLPLSEAGVATESPVVKPVAPQAVFSAASIADKIASGHAAGGDTPMDIFNALQEEPEPVFPAAAVPPAAQQDVLSMIDAAQSGVSAPVSSAAVSTVPPMATPHTPVSAVPAATQAFQPPVSPIPPAAPAVTSPVAPPHATAAAPTFAAAPLAGTSSANAGQPADPLSTPRSPFNRAPRQDYFSATPQAPRGVVPPPPAPLPAQPLKPHRNTGKRIFITLIIVILAAVLVAAAFFAVMYFKNKPSKVVADFIAAVSVRDIDTLEDTVQLDGIDPTDEQWEAFFDTFDTRELRTLQEELLTQADDGLAGERYPAVSIEKAPLLPLINRYEVHISSVSLLATLAADDSTLYLNGTPYTGQMSGADMLFSGLMPGRYQAKVVPPGSTPADISAIEMVIFESNPPTVYGDSEKTTVTVSNCLGTDIQIFVNEQPMDIAPVDGVITIENIILGSIVRIVSVVDGTEMEATVLYSVPEETALKFDNYVPAGTGVLLPSQSTASSTSDTSKLGLTESEIKTIVSEFYQSYLGCINAQNISGIQHVTDEYKTTLEQRIQRDGNRAYTFEYISATPDAATIAQEEGGNILVNVAFSYYYSPRTGGGNPQQGNNVQHIQLTNVNGEWLVCSMEFVEE